MRLSVILPAAGSSSRMKSCVSKQLLKINGVEVLAHTALAFEKSDMVFEIIIVCRQEEKASFRQLVEKYGITKFKCFAEGGNSRQQSVFNAVAKVSDECDYIAIHDGARPLVSCEIIENTVRDAEKYGASAPGVPVKDTIKIIDKDGFVEMTPDRSYLMAIQTPQIFCKDKYIAAMNRAKADGKEYTDDCALFENFGERVYISAGSYDNIKITTEEDILIAEKLMGERK